MTVAQPEALPPLPKPGEYFVFGGPDWHRATPWYFASAASAKLALFTADQMRAYATEHAARLHAECEALRAEQAEPVAVPADYALVRTPITDDMHVAAAKVLARAHGLEGTPQRMLDAMIAAAPPAPARQGWQPLTQSHVDYVLQYGGRCRECADWNGICPSSGLPCGGAEKAVWYVLRALNYGFKHGYITATPAGGEKK